MSIAEWDAVFTARPWGRWPSTRFVEWAMRKYGGVPDRRAVKFLELGCGAGAQLRFLSAEGFTVHGVDGSRAAIQQALKIVSSGALSHGDVRTYEPDLGPYDCVLDVCCLQHLTLAEAKDVAAKARGWLKPGGFFFSMHLHHDSDLPGGDVPDARRLRTDQADQMFGAYATLRCWTETVTRDDGMLIHMLIEAGN